MSTLYIINSTLYTVLNNSRLPSKNITRNYEKKTKKILKNDII